MEPTQLGVIIFTAVLNAAVSFGAFRTQLQWLRADLDRAHKRIDQLARHVGQGADA